MLYNMEGVRGFLTGMNDIFLKFRHIGSVVSNDYGIVLDALKISFSKI